MKNFLLSLCVALLSCVAFAQTNVVVVLKDGTEVKYSATDIDSIRIEKEAPVPADQTGLGLKYHESTMTATLYRVENREAKEVKIPSQVLYDGNVYDVTTIDSSAFWGCASLTSIEIPNSVTAIGEYAFHYCTNLISIVVDKDNKVYDSRENCNAIIETASNTLIAGCQNTVIPNSVTTIGSGAFWECASLTSIEIPNSVTAIDSSAFAWCESLTSIEIPNSVTEIGVGAFSGCSSLTSIVIPESVTEIGSDAFWGCTNLTSIEIPNSVTEIGERAFDGCSSLKPELLIYNNGTKCYGWVGDETKCVDVVIPESVTEIGSSAFSGCTNLTSIVIPESVTSIGEWAFYYCPNLTSIEIPESVTEIGSGAFWECRSLKKARVPKGLDMSHASFPSTCEIEWY